MMKTCSKCGIEKKLECFSKNKCKPDGLQNQCKVCRKQYRQRNKSKLAEYNKQYYLDNKEKINEHNRQYSMENKEYFQQYRKNNREREIERNKQYRLVNKEKIALKDKRYNLNNKDKISVRKKKYYQKNKEYYKQYRLHNKEKKAEYQKQYRLDNLELHKNHSRKRRALKVSVKEIYTQKDEQFTRELFGHRCFICGSIENLTIDHHFPLSLGCALTRNNAVLLCQGCNSSKRDKLPSDFYDEAILDELEHILGIS